MRASLGAVTFTLALAQLGLVVVQSVESCTAAQSGKEECAVEAQDEIDTTSALQIGRDQAKRVNIHHHGADAAGHLHAGGASCPGMQPQQTLKEPVVVESTCDAADPGCGLSVTLHVTTVQMCDPLKPSNTWYTRAYALPGQDATVPGPTLKVKPGEWLNITLVNDLTSPNPTCEQVRTLSDMMMDQLTAFCFINSTNLHVHGLHVSPKTGADDPLESFPPGKTAYISMKLPENHATGTNWYHPHNHHSTSAQAGNGMHGAIVIPDPEGLVPEEVSQLDTTLVVLTLVDMDGVGFMGAESAPTIEASAHSNLWKLPNGKRPSGKQYMLTNGMWQPKMTIEDGRWVRLNFIFATILENVVISAIETGGNNGFACEFGLLAKDGVYLSVAPRSIKHIYLASGNRADVAMKCSCKAGWTGTCAGALQSEPELDAATGSGGAGLSQQQASRKTSLWPFTPFGPGSLQPPQPSTGGSLGGTDSKTIDQGFLVLTVEKSSKPADGALPTFKVQRPCYLVDLTGHEAAPENQGMISLPAPGAPTRPQWPVVYWSNVTTPDDFHGKPFATSGEATGTTDDAPHEALTTMKLGTMQELYLNGGPSGHQPNLKSGAAYKIAGLQGHPFHLHVTQYQIVELLCANNKWITEGGCDSESYYEVGDWHDTLMQSGGAAKVRFQLSTFPGNYIIHCHILSHEDEGMMAYFNVTGEEGTVWPEAKKVDPTCYEGYFSQ